MKPRPWIFFLLGLLIGIGYLGMSYYMHSQLLQSAAKRLSQKVTDLEQQKGSHAATQEKIKNLKTQITNTQQTLENWRTQFQNQHKELQELITQLVQLGKPHHLIFLDYHKYPPSPLPDWKEVTMGSAVLSLGGRFSHISAFLDKLPKSPLPLTKIEVVSANQSNTQLRLTFRMLGNLDTVLARYHTLGDPIP